MIATQTFAGSFPANAQTKAKILSSGALESTLNLGADVFFTLIVVAYLKKYFTQQKYLLLINKAISWLKSQGVVYKDLESTVLPNIV